MREAAGLGSIKRYYIFIGLFLLLLFVLTDVSLREIIVSVELITFKQLA